MGSQLEKRAHRARFGKPLSVKDSAGDRECDGRWYKVLMQSDRYRTYDCAMDCIDWKAIYVGCCLLQIQSEERWMMGCCLSGSKQNWLDAAEPDG